MLNPVTVTASAGEEWSHFHREIEGMKTQGGKKKKRGVGGQGQTKPPRWRAFRLEKSGLQSRNECLLANTVTVAMFLDLSAKRREKSVIEV